MGHSMHWGGSFLCYFSFVTQSHKWSELQHQTGWLVRNIQKSGIMAKLIKYTFIKFPSETFIRVHSVSTWVLVLPRSERKKIFNEFAFKGWIDKLKLGINKLKSWNLCLLHSIMKSICINANWMKASMRFFPSFLMTRIFLLEGPWTSLNKIHLRGDQISLIK